MSLHRTALRLAAVSALTNNFTAPWPTIGEGRIFDSRLDPREGFSLENVTPTAIVYTDGDKGKAVSGVNGGPPFKREVDLIVEIMLGAMSDGAPDMSFDLPVTDAELAAMLDLFEWQVRATLFGGVGRWSAEFLKVAKRCNEFASRPYISSEGGVRMAARELTFTVEITDDCVPGAVVGAAPPTSLPGLLAAFEAAVNADLLSGQPKGYARSVIDLIRAGSPQPVGLAPLQRIALKDAAPPAGSPRLEAVIDDLDD
ncbi:MAG: hypothetical protein NW215_10785 [Hyphomicrobiales bacterium]|nr:hypothetical protein [Hyphomicrobiales bacterium]